MSKQISTQQALSLYREALQRGDLDTVAAILWLAEHDLALLDLINKFHQTHDISASAVDIVPQQTGNITESLTTAKPSPNGLPLQTVHQEEDKIMNIAIPNPNRRMQTYPRMLSAVAAILLLFVFGAVIVTMLALPTGNNFGQIIQLTQEPLKAGCQLTTTAIASDESLRLAQAAHEVRETGEPDTELALLLSICALQTEYSQEAEVALQQAMDIVGIARSFPGNGDSGIALSPDGRYLLTGENKTLRLWDVETGELVREMVGNTEYIRSLAFSPDGRYILSGGTDKIARLWDVETGQEVRQFLHTDVVSIVAFSPDGHFVLSVTEPLPTAHLWDTVTGEEIRQFTGHTSDIFGVAFSPDGRYIATSSWDTTVRLWDTATGEELRQYPRHNSFAGHVSFSSDGRYLLNSGAYVVRLSDVESTETIREYTAQGTRVLGSPSFSPDRRYVLASDRDSLKALIWDADTGELIHTLNAHSFDIHAGRLYGVSFSPDGRFIVMGTANHRTGPDRVWLWETDYRDTIVRACRGVSRDFTAEERAQYGLRDGLPTCPQFAEGYALEPGMTPMPTQPIPVWTPLPMMESTGG